LSCCSGAFFQKEIGEKDNWDVGVKLFSGRNFATSQELNDFVQAFFFQCLECCCGALRQRKVSENQATGMLHCSSSGEDSLVMEENISNVQAVMDILN
jgi:hypothetical protein